MPARYMLRGISHQYWMNGLHPCRENTVGTKLRNVTCHKKTPQTYHVSKPDQQEARLTKHRRLT